MRRLNTTHSLLPSARASDISTRPGNTINHPHVVGIQRIMACPKSEIIRSIFGVKKHCRWPRCHHHLQNHHISRLIYQISLTVAPKVAMRSPFNKPKLSLWISQRLWQISNPHQHRPILALFRLSYVLIVNS